MKEWYQMTEQEVLEQLQARPEGLTGTQAAQRLEEAGENVLQEAKKKSALRIFAEQFCDLLVVILIVAAVISMFSGNAESTVVILAVIVMNAVLGTVQHQKAEKSLESLRALSSPSAKVLRDGQKTEIDARLVVPGDVLLLEAGDLVAADGRVLQGYSLQVNESSLTGESANVDKREGTLAGEVPLAERTNQVFSGSLVTYGRGVVLVTGTGMQTEIGKIVDIGAPAMVEQLVMRAGMIIYTRTVAGLGTLAYAVHQVCMNIQSLSFMNGQAFAVSATSLSGQSLGRKRHDMAQAYISRTRKLGMCVSIFLGVIFFFFGGQIVALYSGGDQSLVDLGGKIMMFVALVQPFQSSQLILAGALRGAGDTKVTAVITFLTVLLVRPALAIFAINVLGMGLEGAWVALVIDQILRSLLVLLRYNSGAWKRHTM